METIQKSLSPLKILQRTWNPLGYHIHHITPVSLGGTDTWDNLVPLLPEDHKLLHEELAAEHNNTKLKYAADLMKCTPDRVAAGKLGGEISGPNAAINGSGFNTFEHRSRGGKTRFEKHGNPATESSLRNGGLRQGNINKMNGHFDKIKTPESVAKGGSVAGKLLWWTNGLQNKRSMTQPSVGFSRGRTNGLTS